MIQVLPVASSHQFADRNLSDSESLCEFSLDNTASVESLHLKRLSLGELMPSVSLSKYLAVLLNTVLMVGFRVSKEQVIWPNARRIITGVANKFAVWNGTVVNEPRKTVCRPCGAVGMYPSIRMARFSPCPATRLLSDIAPKSVFWTIKPFPPALTTTKPIKSSYDFVSLCKERLVAYRAHALNVWRDAAIHMSTLYAATRVCISAIY